MAVISHGHRYLFIQSPRTGCTALAEGVLIPRLDGEQIPEDHLRDAQGRVVVGSKHGTLRELLDYELLGRDEAAALLKFTTVRNPFDSVLSGYLKRAGKLHDRLDDPNAWIHRNPATLRDMQFAKHHSFPEWVEYKFTRRGPKTLWRRRPLPPRHLLGPYLEGVDIVMRFEHLQHDFDGILDRLGVEDDLEIPRLNVTEDREGQRYHDFYDTPARETIERVFAPDLDRFGYAFEGAR